MIQLNYQRHQSINLIHDHVKEQLSENLYKLWIVVKNLF